MAKQTAIPHHTLPMATLRVLLLLLLPGILFPAVYAAANADTTTLQTLYLNPTPPAIIPAFPEQSDVEGCPLDLSDDLFHAIKSACPAPKNNVYSDLHRARCCPVLAAWLYSAYSATALGSARESPAVPGRPPTYDMPLLPDDSETCVDGLGKELKARGIKLAQPNETCDIVYCYCGIRLHPLSCPETFHLTQSGKLEPNVNLKRLEKDCSANGFPGLNGCSKCLNSLHMLHHNSSSVSKSENRTTKMHDKDCKLMGLTWLLSKNRSSYIHTISNVLRAIIMNPNTSSDPLSCSLSSDGLPFAVDSSEISGAHLLTFIKVDIGLLVVSLGFLNHLFVLY